MKFETQNTRLKTLFIFFMKKPLLLALISTTLLLGMPAAAKVVIGQVKISGLSVTDEYVMLYNASSTPANITNWSLKKKTAGGTESNLVATFAHQVMQPFGYLLIAHKNYSITSTPPDLLYSSSDSLAANNSALLYDTDKTLVDSVSWGTASTSVGLAAQNPDDQTVLTRLPNNATGNSADTDDSSQDFLLIDTLPFNSQSQSRPIWISPSQEDITSTISIVPPADLFQAVIINEIMPNPTEGQEWIELYNTTSTPIDLTGVTLCDGRANNCTIAKLEGTIESYGYTVIYLKSNYLNNNGDTVTLLNSSSTIIDTVDYGDIDNGQTIARKADGTDTSTPGGWSVTTDPTPGTPNSITAPPPTPSVSRGGSFIETNTTPSSRPIKTKTDAPEEIKKPTIVFKISLPTYGQAGVTSTFAVTSVADPRGGSVFISWNFGDGTLLEGKTVSHTFTSSGIYFISISATSTRGTTSNKQLSFNVYNQPSTTSVRIEEVYAYPRNDEDSFIELYNASNTTTDISGWQLTTETDKKFNMPSSTTIPAYSYGVFSKLATGLALEHGSETVSLWSASNTLVDVVRIPTSTKGKSFARDITSWTTTEPSPSTPITITEVLGEKIVASTTNKTITKKKVYTNTVVSERTTSIAHARTLPKSTKVSVTGQVTIMPNQLSKHYFYIADATGGIQIYSQKELPTLSEQDIVYVQGTMSSANGILRITVPKTGIISKTKTTSPLQPQTEQIDDQAIGKLFAVTGEITEVATNHLYLDTGENEIRIRLNTQIKTTFQAGDKAAITGIVETNAEGFMLIPRNQNDIEALTTAPPAQKKSFFPFSLFE